MGRHSFVLLLIFYLLENFQQKNQLSMQSVLIVLLCLTFTEQRSTPQDDSYIAAVLEYEVRSSVSENVENYERLVNEAAQQNADIVVFPEMTLTRGERAVNVPINGLLVQQPIPALAATLYDEILVNISSVARQNSVYVVINIQEVLDCTTNIQEEQCPEEKRYLFNTNVIFDREGRVIDRYRKINLFGEFTRTPALQPDLGIFTTDFGVTFGHFICFDLMFQVPSVQIVDKHNLTDIIFTTMWFSEMPYLTAVQIQEAYAYAMDVNFIASGANNVRVGSAGSGIFSGKAGALVSTMPGEPKTRLLVSRVPKVPGKVNFETQGPIYDEPSDHDRLVLISDPSLPSHQSRLLVPGFQEFTLTDKEVSCKFTVRLSERDGSTSHKYRAFVHDGFNKYARRQVGVASCSLVSCKDDSNKHCAYRFMKNDINIEQLEIHMTTHRLQYNKTLQCENVVYYPSTLRSTKFPLNPRNYTFIKLGLRNSEELQDDTDQTLKQNEGRSDIMFKINSPQDQLIAFGIWGRIFLKDVDHTLHYTVTEQDIHNYIEIENLIFALSADAADI